MPTSEDLIRKYANKTPEEMEKEQDKIEQEYNLMSQELDQKLMEASSKIDEMKFGDITVRVKRPTKVQLNRFTPPELAKYREKPESIPYEVARTFEDEIYKLMEELIVMPKHDAKWWMEHTGDEFIAAFQFHIATIRAKIQKDAESFLQQI
jgi:hypothetical protein